MNKFKHTPEPWKVREQRGYPYVAREDSEASVLILSNQITPTRNYDLARTVVCVNGCAGIVDPETTVPELIAAAFNMLQHQRKHGRDNTTVFRELDAALAKAKGK